LISIKQFLKKIYKFEFKTEVGIINFFSLLIIAVIIAFLEISDLIKLIVKIFVPNWPIHQTNLYILIIIMLIYFIISIFIVMIGEKSKIKYR